MTGEGWEEGYPPALEAVLRRSRDVGFLGPGDIEHHVRHSLAFVAAWQAVRPFPPASFLDLGSGGGIPGLVLVLAWPASTAVLLDAQRRRVDALNEALADLGVGGRARAVLGRAEDLARGELREAFHLVTARGFGRPAVTAECGVGFLRAGGLLAVSEPPGAPQGRWPEGPVAALGLRVLATVTEPASITVLERGATLDPSVPRRTGVPAKRPRWPSPA